MLKQFCPQPALPRQEGRDSVGKIGAEMAALEQAEGHIGAVIDHRRQQGPDVVRSKVFEVGVQQQQDRRAGGGPASENCLALASVVNHAG